MARTELPVAFVYPRDYYFPPFFTLQTPATTLHAQFQKWSSLILAYCRYHRIFKLSLIDATDSPLFYNKQLQKRLSMADASEMIDYMRKEGRAEWIGTGKDGRGKDNERGTAWIWWRTPEEWAGLVNEWVDGTGQKGAVLTLYELSEGEATASQGRLSIFFNTFI